MWEILSGENKVVKGVVHELIAQDYVRAYLSRAGETGHVTVDRAMPGHEVVSFLEREMDHVMHGFV